MPADPAHQTTDWPGPNDDDRAAWDAYNARGAGLPPYEDADDELRRMWWAIRRLTVADIADAVERIAADAR